MSHKYVILGGMKMVGNKTTKVDFGGEGVLKSHFPQNCHSNIFHIKIKTKKSNIFFKKIKNIFKILKIENLKSKIMKSTF